MKSAVSYAGGRFYKLIVYGLAVIGVIAMAAALSPRYEVCRFGSLPIPISPK